jgi:predicted GIY-YIG superfamily endonuclease
MATLTLSGISGQKYEFIIYSKDTDFHAVGAVYAITRAYHKLNEIKSSHHLIYIGQTDDLSQRFDYHHQLNCFNRHKWNRICIHLDENETSRLEKERDLIDNYDPICNRN